jgi:hypothetical protein
MIYFSVNKTKYKLKTTWDEITIQDAIALTEISLPETLQTKFKDGSLGLSDFMDLAGLDYVKKSVSHLAGIAPETLNQTHAGDVLNLFTQVFPLIVDIYSATPRTYTPRMIEHFEHKGQRYMMPVSKIFNGVLMPGVNVDSVTFVESANLMAAITQLKEKGLVNMPALIACYCRPAGEQFDQFTILQRAEEFKELPMAVAWEVFFYMAQSLTIAMKDILTYLNQALEAPRRETFRTLVSDHFRRGFMRRLKRDMETGKRLN